MMPSAYVALAASGIVHGGNRARQLPISCMLKSFDNAALIRSAPRRVSLIEPGTICTASATTSASANPGCGMKNMYASFLSSITTLLSAENGNSSTLQNTCGNRRSCPWALDNLRAGTASTCLSFRSQLTFPSRFSAVLTRRVLMLV